MRVGLYHDDLPVPGIKPGGVPVLVHRLARELSLRHHDVTVWTRGSAPADANYRHVRLWPRLSGDSKLLRTFVIPVLHNAVKWQGIDVLHLHGDDFFMFRRSVPTVRTLHGSALLEARYATSLKRAAFQTVIAGLEYFSTRLATVSYGVGPGVPAMYPTVGSLDNGVEVPASVALERQGAPAILFVGTWEGRKRGKMLHRLFLEQVRRKVPDAELWMVSDRCEPATGVHWIAAPTDAQLVDLYRRAWVMCHPSRYEGFGITYLEAMANGLPIVSSPNPGARYVLGEKLSEVSLIRDEELGNSLVEVLLDGRLRRDRARQGRQRVKHFSWDAVIERHLAAYRLAIATFHS